jgi:hypothetical protein
MTLTARKYDIIRFVAESGVTDTPRVRKRLFPADRDGSVTRRELSELASGALIHRHEHRVARRDSGAAPSIYYPAPAGLRALALHTGDMRWLRVCTQKPYKEHLEHFLGLGDVSVLVREAVASQGRVRLVDYFNEFDVINPHAHRSEPHRRFKLYTLIQERPKRLVCCPDGAFALEVGAGFATRVVYYLELERGTSTPEDAAGEKSPGYAALAKEKLHLRHFEGAIDDFRVLVLAPHAQWRDSLLKAFAEKQRPELYKFAALPEMTKDTFLFGEIWHAHGKKPHALVARPEGEATPGATAAERGGQ